MLVQVDKNIYISSYVIFGMKLNFKVWIDLVNSKVLRGFMIVT